MAFSMDQKNSNHSSPFYSQPQHDYSQAPSSHDLPTSHHPYQHFLQNYQASQPYLLSHNHIRNPGHLHWSYPNQQRFNGMTASSTGQGRQVGQTVANRNDSRSRSSIPSHEEDLISFDEEPAVYVQNPRPFQQMQSLSRQPNAMRAPVVTMGRTAWTHPSNMQTGGAWQYRMDNTIHQVRRPQVLSHHRSVIATLGQQNARTQQAGICHNFSTQQPMNTGYPGGQSRLFQLPLQQLSTPQGVRNNHGTFNGTYKPIVVPGYNQHGVINNQSRSSTNATNIRSNISVQNTNPQPSLLQSVVQPTVQKKDGDTGAAPNSTIPPPKAETIIETSQKRQVAGLPLTISKSETNPQQSSEKSVAKAQTLKVADPPRGPRSMPQQKQTKLGHNPVPGKRPSQNRAPVSRGQNTLPPRNNPFKDSIRPSDRSSSQSMVAQEQISKRIIRTAVFNSNAGEVMQGSEKEVAQSTILKTVELQKENKQDPISTKDETVSNSSHSTQQSRQDAKMTSAISQIARNSGKRLLSFDELFGSSSNEVEQALRPLCSPALEAIQGRPPSLYELMQLRNAAKAASKSSISTISRSPSPDTKADQAEISEDSKISSEQMDSPAITASLDTSRPVLPTDQDVAKVAAETCSRIIEPAGVQDSSDVGTTPTHTSTNQEDMESTSNRPTSQSGSSTTIEPSNEPASESVVSTNTESTHNPSTTSALIAKLDNTPPDPVPCRFCPDEYRTTLARDQHEIICRRKAGWPKNCCFCGISLSNRDALAVHARICTKSRGEALRSTSLSRYVASNPIARASTQTTPVVSPTVKARTTPPAQIPGASQSTAKNNLPTSRRRGARGKMTMNSTSSPIGTNRNTSANKPPATTTTQTSVPDAKETPISTPTLSKPTPADGNGTTSRSRRSRRRGSRKS